MTEDDFKDVGAIVAKRAQYYEGVFMECFENLVEPGGMRASDGLAAMAGLGGCIINISKLLSETQVAKESGHEAINMLQHITKVINSSAKEFFG